MLKIIKSILIIIAMLTSSGCCFMQPYNYWHCIDLIKNIDKSKPYSFNIGELPLITWFNDTQPITTINICKHMGSKLDDGKITSKGCLKCPYHGLEHSIKDNFGESMIFQDKLWWSYEPIKNKPLSIPFYNNENYATTSFTLDMNANVKDCMINTFDIYHFAHVHGNLFGHNEPPRNYKFSKLTNDKLSVSYRYKTNKNIEKIKPNLHILDNFQIFEYPYTSSSILKLDDNEKIIIHVNMLPLSVNKTKWIVTLKHNFWKSYFDKMKIDLVLKYILHQDQSQLCQISSTNLFKNNIVFKHEEHFKHINKMYNSYKFPDMYSTMMLYNYHKNNDIYYMNDI
jgi:phenylpropionate dioxygenase-like ring-hydroxylating dioxygenase large terminal subunit